MGSSLSCCDSEKVDEGLPSGDGRSPWRIFTFKELHSATNGFSEDNKLGEGGFGSVYWGKTSDGLQIAVKQLKSMNSKAEMEFAVEVEVLGRVRHKNLLGLRGYCASAEQRLIVYDYMPNLSLLSHLHGQFTAEVRLDWKKRMKVAIGSAEGLLYLHHEVTPHIIHRDIKASNVLLDSNFEPLVADFGFAKLIPDGVSHMTTRVKGTLGYLAPEYAMWGKVSESCDVYSFGILLLELVTGRKPIEKLPGGVKRTITEWAEPYIEKGRFRDLADPKLRGNFDEDQLKQFINAAALCVQSEPERRPNMKEVVALLKGYEPKGKMMQLRLKSVKYGDDLVAMDQASDNEEEEDDDDEHGYDESDAYGVFGAMSNVQRMNDPYKSSSGPLPVEHSVVAQGCGLSTIHSHTPFVRPTVSTPCVRQLDASSDIRRLNELKRNVVDQDDHQVNLPSKKTCVCLLNSFPYIHQQSVNPVNVNTPSTPVDDHDDHGHNGLHVGAERIPFSERGSHRPDSSLDSRLTPTVNTNNSQRRNRQSSTVNLSTSRQQPPASRPTSDYRYLESCTYSCQHCGALFWGDERLKSVPRTSRPRYNRCCRGGRVVLRTYQMHPEYMKLLLQDRHFLENIRISGQLYHWIGSLCPIEGEPPRFLQLYIYDTDNEVDNRMTYFGGQNSNLRRDIVEGLTDLFDTHNRLVQLFRTAREKYQDTHVLNFKIRLYNVVGAREYELPTGDMLGAIVYETGPESDMDYDIVLEERSGLFQQYGVTAFCAIEQNRIDYVREHQNDIRSEYLSGIYDAINRGDSDGSDCGIRVILPQSFTGEPRYMYNHYLDALAICRVYGNPSFFITFTCNVKWPEITEYMAQFPLLTTTDRAYVVDRVFEMKIHQFITFLRDAQPFGKTVASIFYN
nr:PTI1-like tyrosine-protein kinase At3g15890 [Tanacetum cinerariifolium]